MNSRTGDTARAMSQENVEIVRRIWELTMEGIERGDPAAGFNAAYDQGLISADSTFTPVPAVPGSQTSVGRDGFAEFLRSWTDEFADWKMWPDEILDAGDEQVVAIVRQAATGRGSGATVELLFAVVYRLKDGHVIDRRHYLEPHEALKAAGLRE